MQNNFLWFPTLKECFTFNFPLTHVLMIIPCWQLLTPKKFLYWLRNQKCHSKLTHNTTFPRLWMQSLGSMLIGGNCKPLVASANLLLDAPDFHIDFWVNVQV